MKKVIMILVVVMIVGGILYFGGWIGKVPVLEYKYKKGETLYYAKKGKERAWSWGFQPRYWKIGPAVKDRHIMELNIKDITDDGKYIIETEEGVPEGIYTIMSRKGDIPVKAEDIFLSTQPRFEERRAKSWKKTIYLPGYRKRVEILANYKILGRVLWKRNTYRIMTTYVWFFVDDQKQEYVTRLKGYSNFDAERGRITKMKSSLETRLKGKMKYTQKIEAKWRLMSEEELFKSSGLEKDWELVVDYAGEFDLSKDGKKFVYETNPAGRYGHKEIWIADADGSNSRRLPVLGWYPKWSQDGSMIAYTTLDDFTAPPPRIGELHIINLLGNDKKVGNHVRRDGDYYWLSDGRLLFYEELQNDIFQCKVIELKTDEIIEIEHTTAASLYQKERFQDNTEEEILPPGKKEPIRVPRGWDCLWSPDRQVLLIGGQMKPLRIKLLDGKEDVLIPEDKMTDLIPQAWASDGRFFIYKFIDRNPEPDLYSLKLYSLEKRDTIKQLTGWKSTPFITVDAWSPDGRYIYFHASNNVSHRGGIYRLKLPDEIITKEVKSSQK